MRTYNNELQSCTTETALKRMYYEMSKLLHPDRAGGNKEAFQALTADYERTFAKVKGITIGKNGTVTTHTTSEKADYYTTIINELIKIKGLKIEILGTSLWIGGRTKENKDKLKKLGAKYASKKKMWYVSPQGFHKMSRDDWSMSRIRSTFKNNGTYDTDDNAIVTK